MGWWEQRSARWQACIIAQLGSAPVLGGGVFFMLFRSPDVPLRPVFLAVAGGVAAAPGMGSAASIPFSEIIRQLINPNVHPETAEEGWASFTGTFACQDIQREKFDIAQLGSAHSWLFSVTEVGLFQPDREVCSARLTVPAKLPQLGQPLLDLPPAQAGRAAGYTGTIFYIGTG
jgi:hypothetical protein